MAGYVAGWNKPGYLPVGEPEEFDSFDDAKRYIIDELLSVADIHESESVAEGLTHLAEDVNLESGPFEIEGEDGYVYWIAAQGEE